MQQGKRVSSKDVAKEAGVSQATVSYVLNNVQGIKIKQETRESVLAAAKKLNYYPNLIAKSMRLKKSMSIGIVSDKSISSFMFMNVLEGIKEGLVSRNYSMTLCLNRSSEFENAEYIKYYNSHRIDGIIFAFTSLSDEQLSYLIDNNIPFAMIHTNVRNEVPHLVKTDMFQAVYEGVKGLKQRYGSEIAFFGTNAGNIHNRRYESFINALKKCDIEFDEKLNLKFESRDEGVFEIMESYEKHRGKLPRSVFCDSAYLAFNVLKYAAHKDIKVPQHMAVTAIGTSNFSPYSYPELSAIEAPLYNMGYTGCEMLFSMMDDSPYNDVVVLEWNYVQRGSS